MNVNIAHNIHFKMDDIYEIPPTHAPASDRNRERWTVSPSTSGSNQERSSVPDQIVLPPANEIVEERNQQINNPSPPQPYW